MKFSVIISIVVLCILFFNTSGSIGVTNINDDELDQFQTHRGGNNNQAAIGGPTYCFAQSFKPSLNTLTRIELLILRDGNPTGNLTISIRKNLNANDLTAAEISANEISTKANWYEFDFTDIQIPPEYPFYIVWHPPTDLWEENNLLLCACNWETDRYHRGEMWREYPSENWYVEDPKADLCFKTYGYNRENEPPNNPDINGTKEGAIEEEHEYVISAIDDDSDDLYYFIDWGDGTNSSWIGPYTSGHQRKISHIWEEEGDYVIKVKAKDIFYEESDWSIFKVTMPINKLIHNTFFRLLENHPFLFTLFHKFLKI